MFQALLNPVYTPSGATAVVSNNTDFSIDGSSKKIVFTATGAYVTLSFTSINLSNYEELCFYAYTKPLLGQKNAVDTFKIVIGSNEYSFKQLNENSRFVFCKIDCQNLGTITSFKIQALRDDLTMFFDYPIARKASPETMDIDIMKALADKISVQYNQSTTISDDVSAGDEQILLTSSNYIFDRSVVRITEGAKTEEVTLINASGELETGLVNDYNDGATVEVVVPVKYGKDQDITNDPVVGILITDKMVDKDYLGIKMQNGYQKKKVFLGKVLTSIYIECSSEKKLLYMARQFELEYGKEFQFLLDGELVEAYLVDSNYIGKEEGGLPRSTYFYEIYPQPLTIATGVPVTDMTIDLNSEVLDV